MRNCKEEHWIRPLEDLLYLSGKCAPPIGRPVDVSLLAAADIVLRELRLGGCRPPNAPDATENRVTAGPVEFEQKNQLAHL